MQMLIDVVLSVLHSTLWSLQPCVDANCFRASSPAVNSRQLELLQGAQSPSGNFIKNRRSPVCPPPAVPLASVVKTGMFA